MPLLEVEIVLSPGEVLSADLARSIAEEAGGIFASPPGHTWVRLRSLQAHAYAENGGGPPAGVYPVFVNVLKSVLPRGEALQAEVDALTGVVARLCGRSAQNVHIIYLPEAAGRVAFGGRLVQL
jgi:hypothetical protein